LRVDVEQIRAKLLAGVNFEQGHGVRARREQLEERRFQMTAYG